MKQIRLKDGTVLDADLVVFAVGIRPNIALAQSAGLRCNRGVLVNDTMQTFDPSIYAVGECIEHRGQTLVWLSHYGASFYLRDPFSRARQFNF